MYPDTYVMNADKRKVKVYATFSIDTLYDKTSTVTCMPGKKSKHSAAACVLHTSKTNVCTT